MPDKAHHANQTPCCSPDRAPAQMVKIELVLRTMFSHADTVRGQALSGQGESNNVFFTGFRNEPTSVKEWNFPTHPSEAASYRHTSVDSVSNNRRAAVPTDLLVHAVSYTACMLCQMGLDTGPNKASDTWMQANTQKERHIISPTQLPANVSLVKNCTQYCPCVAWLPRWSAHMLRRNTPPTAHMDLALHAPVFAGKGMF